MLCGLVAHVRVSFALYYHFSVFHYNKYTGSEGAFRYGTCSKCCTSTKAKIFNFQVTFNCLISALVAEGHAESRIDIERNKCNRRYICNTNAFIFSTCSYILCDGQENYSFFLEKKLYSNSY